MNERNICIGVMYRHFKGNLYKTLAVATHTETGEEMVVYEALYGDHKIWTRPLSMFLEDVTRDGITRPRFELVEVSHRA
jgi:hypothetical protein